MKVEKVLERIGPIKEEVIINKKFFYCGRMKESDLVCLSLLVSREHCVFTTFSDGSLYVTDLGSSNGVYLNGVPIRQKKQFPLKENDYIGIGCAEITNLNESMFVYKLKNRVVISNDCDSSSNVYNDKEQKNARLVRKEQSRSRKSDSDDLPKKIPKKDLDDIITNCNSHNSDAVDDDIIEIISCVNSSSLTKKNVNNFNGISILDSKIEKSENNLNNEFLRKTASVNIKKEITERSDTIKGTQIVNDVIDITDEQTSCAQENHNKILQVDLLQSKDNRKDGFMHSKKSNKTPADDNISSVAFIKQEPEENNEVDMPDTKIKTEPDSFFSQIDLVEKDDNDDSVFPFSQLFDNTNIKEECEDNNYSNINTSIFEDDEEIVITILDSDEENNFEVNEIINYDPKSRIEPDAELVSKTDSSSLPTSNEIDGTNINQDIVNDKEQQSNFNESFKSDTTSKDKILRMFKEQPSNTLCEKPLSDPSTSNDISVNNKAKRKKLEIIEPHFLSSKIKSKKTEKDDKKKSKSKEKSGKRSSDKKKCSSDSSKNSCKEKRLSDESLSRSKKHKKGKEDYSAKSSLEKNTNKQSSDKNEKHGKEDNSSSKSSRRNDDPKDKNAKEKIHQNSNDSDTVSVQDNSASFKMPNQTRPRHKTTIVKAKVSQKTRGDMLCDSMQTLKPKPKTNAKTSSSKSSSLEASKNASKSSADIPFTYVIPRRQINPSSSNTTTISTNDHTNTFAVTSSNEEITPAVLQNTTNHINVSQTSSNSNDKTSSLNSLTNNNNAVSTLPIKSSLVMPSLLNTNQKTVTFKENVAAVKEFEIEPGNKMKSIKDGLKIRSTKNDFAIYKSMELKIEDFLARIFAWEPVWLEQQQKAKTLPPIVNPNDMQKLLHTFDSFQEYYKRMEILLLLETWQQLLKEYECTGIRYKTCKTLPCKIVRHSIRQMQTPYGLRYSTLTLNTLVSKKDLQLQSHPVYGDMVILEYTIKQGNEQKIRRTFAYVILHQQQNSLKFLRTDEILCKHVTNADTLLTYVVQTRIIDEHMVQFDQIGRFRSIIYLRPHLRLIQGLQYVPHSDIRNFILKVYVDDFQLEPIKDQQIYKYQLVTNDKLNEKQMESIIKFTNVAIKLEPKIGLLIGPPGTGKSKVITNLVMQILYGDSRYVNGRPLRILVCAPSNAAIDEIVLRLLEIRAAIKDHRFKMVRIGRMESMHEEVKKISVSELAKREAQKTYIDQQHKTIENIEHKKHKLKSNIDALESLVASNPHNKIYKKDLEEQKAKYKKLTNKSPEEEAAELNKLQNSAKMLILQKADVIACTLSSCYTSQMETIFGGSTEKIATCIVDEATQCCEAETLIPLMLGVKNLILVGDPNQLPATVMSTDAKKLGLDRSLFTRLKESLETQCNAIDDCNKNPVITLNMQYRMVNAISHWPNHYFYGGKLVDRVSYKQTFPFQPYRVLSLDGLQDDIKFSNTSEAVFVGNLINCMMMCGKVNSWDKKITIGVITPYQNQKSLILSTIKEEIKNVPDVKKNKFVTEVNTIDSFQGQERDVIIMSCVRSSGIGFLSDQQRLCVALTRAKFTLIICGNFATFQRDNMWNDLLRDARSRGVVARLNTSAKSNEIKPHVVRI